MTRLEDEVNTKANLIVTLAGLCLASAAFAHDVANERSRPTFEEIDANKDMLISPDEIEAFMESRSEHRRERQRASRSRTSRFDSADEDGDGYVNETEFNALRDHKPEGRKGHRRRNRTVEDDDEM